MHRFGLWIALLVSGLAGVANGQGMPQHVRTQIQSNLIGEWGLTITYDGEVSLGSMVNKWTANGEYSVQLQCTTTSSNGKSTTIVALMGWDSQHDCLREQGFDSDGGHFTNTWSELTPAKWTGQGTGVFLGKPMTSIATIEFHGDKFVYRDVSHGKPFVFEAVRR